MTGSWRQFRMLQRYNMLIMLWSSSIILQLPEENIKDLWFMVQKVCPDAQEAS